MPAEGENSVLPRHSACLGCRKRKQKCDATKPECLECIAVNRKCQYEDETYRSRTQLLQDRIKELEEQIRRIEEAKNAPPPMLVPASHSTDNSHNQSPDPSSSGSSGLPSDESRSPTISPPSSIASESGAPLGSFVEATHPWPTPHVTKRLIDIFFLRYAQCGFELHPGRVMHDLQAGVARPIIPVLLNAILLLACHFVQDPELEAWETSFLQRTKSEIEANIVRAHRGQDDDYNCLDHFQAMLMLGIYYYFKGRLLEGHFHTSQATRFGMTLGCHRLNSRIFHRENTTNETKPSFSVGKWHPNSSLQLGEAINLWWTCFCWDMGGSTLNGLPPSISFGEVTTVWPWPLQDFETGHPLPIDDYSIPSIFDQDLFPIIADISRDNLKSLMSKSFILMRTAINLDSARVSGLYDVDEWWLQFERCDRSLDLARHTMPPLHFARNLEELVFNVLVHSSIYCGEVILHGSLAEYEITRGARGDPRYIRPDGSFGGLSYDRCSEACRAVILVAAIVEKIDMSYMHMFIGVAWVCVSEMLAIDLPRLRRSGNTELADKKQHLWELLESCMGKLLATYPVLKLQLDQLRSSKREQMLQLAEASLAPVSRA